MQPGKLDAARRRRRMGIRFFAVAALFGATAWAQAPTGLTVKAATSKRIDLTWSGTASSYSVQRRVLGGAYASVGSVTSAAFSDTQIDPYTTYQYEVTATTVSGASAPSNEVTVGPPPAGYTVASPAPGVTDAADRYGYDLSLVLDSNGDPAFAFLFYDPNGDTDPKDTQLLFRSWNRARYAWNSTVTVATVGDTATYFWNTLSLAFDSSTGAFAVATESPSGPIVVYLSTDGGGAWTKKATLAGDGGTLNSPSLALANGNLYLAFVESSEGLKYMTGKLSSDAATWITKKAPVPSGTDIAYQGTTASLALDSAGNPAVAYFVPNSKQAYWNIVLYWRPESGTTPVRATDNQEIQSDEASVKLAFHGLNPRLLVYEPRLNEDTGDAVHVVKSDDGGLTWSTPVQIPPDGNTSTDFPFDLALDSKGDAAVSFGRNSGSGGPVQCGFPKVSRSTDFVHWTTCAATSDDLPFNFGVYPGAIQIAYGGNDRLYLLWWEDSDNPTGNGILMYREPPASAVTGPTISSAVNGASFQPGIVPGSWVTIQGANLSTVTRTWTGDDFVSGDLLPTNLSGAQVKFNGLPAAVYYVSPTQLNVQAPAGISGSVNIQVTDNGVTSNTLSASSVSNAPALFTYSGGSKIYPAAVFSDGTIVGDPAAVPGTQKAHAGDRVLLYATGLAASPAGNIVRAPIVLGTSATVSVGGSPAAIEFAGLVAVGEFQINIVVPNLPAGDYPIVVMVNGQASQVGVTLPVR
jgi:uncharacterized protein (TIGR03437 family)